MENRRKTRLPSLGPRPTDQSITDFSTKASLNSSIFNSAVRPLSRKSTSKFGGNQTQNSARKTIFQSSALTPIRNNNTKRSYQPISKLAQQNHFASTPRVPGFGGNKENILEGSIFQAKTPSRKGISFNQTLNSSRHSNANSRNDFSVQDVPSKTDLKDSDVQQDQVSNILDFIKLHGYTKECAVKDLCPPNSASTYYSIWEFLVIMVDPKFTWEPKNDLNTTGRGKPPMQKSKPLNRLRKEEIIIDYIKNCGYPHVIPSKSVFNTISQKSSWPPLLSILIFHKQLAQFSIQTKDDFGADLEIIDQLKSNFLKTKWLSLNMIEYANNQEDIHEIYKQNKLLIQTDEMGTVDDLEFKYDELKADIREIEIEKCTLRENNSELQTLRIEVDNLKIQDKKIQKEIDETRSELHRVKTMEPKKEIEKLDLKIFETDEKLLKQGDTKSNMNRILNDNNMKISEVKSVLADNEEQLNEISEERNKTGKILDGKLHDLMNMTDQNEFDDLDTFETVLKKEILERNQQLNGLKEKHNKAKTDIQNIEDELVKATKSLKAKVDNLNWVKNHLKELNEKKELDVEEQLSRYRRKEQNMMQEQADKRRDISKLEKSLREMEDELTEDWKRLHQLHSDLEKKYVIITQKCIDFAKNSIKNMLDNLTENLKKSEEEFKQQFLNEIGKDLNKGKNVLLAELDENDADMTTPNESTNLR